MASRRWLAHAFLLMTILLASCGILSGETPTPTAEPGTPPEAATEQTSDSDASPQVLRIGWSGSPDTLHPGTSELFEGEVISSLVYDTLYQPLLDDSIVPLLIEDVEVSDDGTVWTFTLKDGVTFHDGEPLTAEDVAFSLNLYKDHEEFVLINPNTEHFDSIEATDDRTVVLTLSEAIPNLEAQLLPLVILPEHIWSALEGDALIEFENEEMIGSGPFQLVEYRQDEFVRLAANKDHFLSPPTIDEVIFQTFANQDALVQALTTGQVDMIMEMPNTAVATLRNADDIELVVGAPFSPAVRTIFPNQVAPEDCPPEEGVCSGHPALRDRAVRLALSHATDKQKMIDVALLGLGTPGITLIPDGLGKWFNNTIEDYPFDIAEANRILDEAGYADSDGDGVREMPDGGQPLSFRLYWPGDMGVGPRLAELLNETWSQIGIALQPQAIDPGALTTACCPAFDYDIIMWGWTSDYDGSGLLSGQLSEDIPTGNNETGYANPQYDELFAQQAVELDPEQRREIMWEMQEIMHDDVVYIIPYYDQEVQAYRSDRFTGWITDAPRVALQDRTSLTVLKPVEP